MKRFISMLLCISLIIGACPVAFGAETDSDVSELILYAKNFFSIGVEYDDFDYTYEISDGETVYNFNWKNTETDETIKVSVNSDKYILGYIKSETEQEGLGTAAKEEAIAAADAFIERVVPEEYAENIELTDVYNYGYSYAPSYSVAYIYKINDIPVAGGDFICYVSKYTGEVTRYYAPSKKYLDIEVPDPNGFVSAEEAETAYKGNSDMFLKYYVRHGDDNDNSVYLAYRLEDYPEAIDAVTGEAVSDFDFYDEVTASAGDYGFANKGGGVAFDAVAEESEAELGEAEIASIEDKLNLLSAEEALAVLEKEIYIADKSNMTSSLSKNSASNEYYWRINIENASVDFSARINAASGRVLSYYNYAAGDYNETSEAADYETMLNTAQRIASAFGGDNFNETELEYNENISYNGNIYGYDFDYVRVVNGVKFSANRIDVEFDQKGQLESYTYNWSDDYTFPAVTGAIDVDRAYEILGEISEPELWYVAFDNNNVKALYIFSWDEIYLSKTGQRLTSWGDIYEEEQEFAGYSDIEGTKYEDIIKLLYNNGYYLDREEFKPQESISAKDFFEFFQIPYKIVEGGVSISYTKNQKVYGETLTRYETAEILAWFNNYGGLTEHPEIFDVSYYKDEIAEEYKAAVAICYGLGYMTGDELDSFNGDKVLTNEEAAIILYKYLTNK